MVSTGGVRAYVGARVTGRPLLVVGSAPESEADVAEPFDGAAGRRLARAAWGSPDVARLRSCTDRMYLNPVPAEYAKRFARRPLPTRQVGYDSGAGQAVLDVLEALVEVGEVPGPQVVLVLGAAARTVLATSRQVCGVATYGVLNPSAGRGNLMMADPGVRLRNAMRIREAFRTAGVV